MKNARWIVLAIALTGCGGQDVPRLRPGEIKQRADECRSAGLVPSELVNMAGYVYDVVCLLPHP
jgi:hypothetical protein